MVVSLQKQQHCGIAILHVQSLFEECIDINRSVIASPLTLDAVCLWSIDGSSLAIDSWLRLSLDATQLGCRMVLSGFVSMISLTLPYEKVYRSSP